MGHDSSLITLEQKRKTKFDKRLGVIQNGEDNAYPTFIERLINNSVTAKQSAKVYSKFIRGLGFTGAIGKLTVGRERNRKLSLNKLLKKLAYDLARFQGAFIHVNYNLLGEITELKHVPFKHVRFGRKDSQEYAGKVVIYNNWDKSQGARIERNKFNVVDVYNDDPKVIQAQIESATRIDLYKGQVFALFLDEEYDYPIATIDGAEHHALTESNIGLFQYNILENDFILDRVIIFHNEMDDNDLKKLKANLQGMKGAKGQGHILTIEDEIDEDMPNGQFRFEYVKSGLNDKLFDSWEKSVSNNIRRTFNNVPQILIDEIEGKLGNSSGEAYKEAQRYFNRQTQEERDEIVEAFTELLSHFDKNVAQEDELEIEEFNIIDDELDEIAEEQENEQQSTNVKESAEERKLKKQAQAQLRGSVGGVTGLLSINASVAEGTTEYESAVTILTEVYGFSDEVARSMLGSQTQDDDDQTQNDEE